MKDTDVKDTKIGNISVEDNPPEIDNEALAEIARHVEIHGGIKLYGYKENYLKRRIAIRMRWCNCIDAAAYCSILRSSNEELKRLTKALTIHVSSFFRNSSLFECLIADVMPYLFKETIKEKETPLSILSLGSACGEEPYTIALLLKEYFSSQMRHTPVRITGIDIDSLTIDQAREAIYSQERLQELPKKFRNHFLITGDGRYRLSNCIKEMVTFCQGDISASAIYDPAQLVLCRNTLIYFTRPLQEKILNAISCTLPVGGILVLGKSETLVGDARSKFEAVSLEERIYRKK